MSPISPVLPVLLIAYDLADPAAVPAGLIAAITQAGLRYARPLASLWYVETDATVADIEAVLTEFLGSDDGLLVQQVTGQAAVSNTMLRWSTGRTTVASDTPRNNIVHWPGPLTDQARLPYAGSTVAEAA